VSNAAGRGSGPGWASLDEVAEAVWDAFGASMDDEGEELLLGMSAAERVRALYTRSDCDDFAVALHRMTGWPIVRVDFPDAEGGFGHHTLVRVPDGTQGGGRRIGGLLLDAVGLRPTAAVRRRHGGRRARISGPGGEELAALGASDDHGDPGVSHSLAMAASAVRQLPWPPFDEAWFRATVSRPLLGVDVPRSGLEPAPEARAARPVP